MSKEQNHVKDAIKAYLDERAKMTNNLHRVMRKLTKI